jgi:BCD family chlorophyll transporter-like MFS transporter
VSAAARILNHVRLGAFPIAYGLSGVLIGGTLNRVMIAELKLPATLVALLFALPLLVSPLRLWLGYRSDGFPILGRRREPYMLFGAVLIATGVAAIATIAVRLSGALGTFVPAALAAFLLYGVGRNLAHNTYQALLAEKFTGSARARAVTLYEVVTLLGSVAGAGALGRALEHYEPARLVTVANVVAVIVVLLALVAVPGQETRGPAADNAEQARGKPFGEVLRRYVLADPQVRRLFAVVICTFIGTLAQDVLLEPYGALVLGMTVGQTTRLTMFWGLGVLAAMLLSGLYLQRALGPMRLMRVGLIFSVVVFAAVAAVGLAGRAELFRWLVLAMGFGTGLAGAGMLGSVVEFTTPVRAGLLMGVWGVANMLGHACGSLMGGIVVDTMRLATGSALTAYTALFVFEVAMLLCALALTFRLAPAAMSASHEAPSAVK